VKQGTVAQTTLVKLALPSLFDYVLCKVCTHQFDLLIRKSSSAGLDGFSSISFFGTNSSISIVRLLSMAMASSSSG
jgi:hypothetical protein